MVIDVDIILRGAAEQFVVVGFLRNRTSATCDDSPLSLSLTDLDFGVMSQGIVELELELELEFVVE